MYSSVIPFNQSLAGKIAGSCLQNVRKGYSIPVKYPNAITSWSHTEQHADRNIPTSVDVPLFYSYSADGHINVRLANGQVWSDGNLYASLDDYLSRHPSVHYLGWGESINDVRVIEGEDMIDRNGAIDLLTLANLSPTQTEDAIKSILGQPYPDAVRALLKNGEHIAIIDKLNSASGSGTVLKPGNYTVK